jgi:hypothetical protein
MRAQVLRAVVQLLRQLSVLKQPLRRHKTSLGKRARARRVHPPASA